MTHKIVNEYTKLGINVQSNKTLIEFLNLINIPDEPLKRQFIFFHQDLIVSLNEIKKSDYASFESYIDKINGTKGKINFWGEKFEIYIHSRLLKMSPCIIDNLKRGIDGKEPDIVFEFNGTRIGIELTTAKFIKAPNVKYIFSKLTECILIKNDKIYSNNKCALLIDITNIVGYEKALGFDTWDSFKTYFNGFKNSKMNLGMIIFCNSMFVENDNGELEHRLNPFKSIMSEESNINFHLKAFLDILFNNFKSDNKFKAVYYHQNF